VTLFHKSLVVVSILAVAALAAALGLRAVGRGSTPVVRRPLATLDATRLATQFDTARDSTRLLVLLSPT
jgi:hypothetical protein